MALHSRAMTASRKQQNGKRVLQSVPNPKPQTLNPTVLGNLPKCPSCAISATMGFMVMTMVSVKGANLDMHFGFRVYGFGIGFKV